MDKLEFYKKFGWNKITCDYGDRVNPFDHKTIEFHQGIDLVKEHHGEVKAFTEGEVTYADFGQAGTGLGGYGNVVAILDANNCVQVYGHLSEVKVHKGYKVKKGDVIGLQGNTGQSTGEHLHFEVRKRNNASHGWEKDRKNGTHNPTDYLDKYYKTVDSDFVEVKKVEVKKEPAKPAVHVKDGQYKIKAGDTITSIANDHKMTNEQLLKLNPQVKNPSKIKAGAILNVK